MKANGKHVFVLAYSANDVVGRCIEALGIEAIELHASSVERAMKALAGLSDEDRKALPAQYKK